MLGLETKPFDYEEYFTKMIRKKKESHTYRVFRKVNRKADDFPKAHDYTHQDKPKDITIWCSNDCLGMSRHETVKNATKSVVDAQGVGAGGARGSSGTSTYHCLLEESVANLHQKESGLLFSSCFVANETALYTLGQNLPGCLMFASSGNHASLIHGVRTSQAPKKIFRNNDPKHLEELLRESDPNVPKIVVFETVHSMTGAVCPLEELCDVSHKYGALTFVDETHAIGLYGKHGGGIGERDGVMYKMDIISGTFAKAVGCIGGYLAGNAEVIDVIRNYGVGFMYTTALPPDKINAALLSLELLKSEEGQKLREKHQGSVKRLLVRLAQHGFPVERTPSHIVPILVQNPHKALQIMEYLQMRYGIYIQAINYPTVPRGREKLRLVPTPFHTEEMMDELIKALDEAWRDANLSFLEPVHSENVLSKL